MRVADVTREEIVRISPRGHAYRRPVIRTARARYDRCYGFDRVG